MTSHLHDTTKKINPYTPNHHDYLDWAINVHSCTVCPIAILCKKGKVLPHYSTNEEWPQVMFVGEAPGESEYARGEPFIGWAGEELKKVLAESIIPMDIPYIITNSILCTPFKDEDLDDIRAPSLSEVTACRQHLKSLLSIIKPKVVIALGKVAARSLKPICEKFAQVMHPSGILQSSHPALERNRAILRIREAIKEL